MGFTEFLTIVFIVLKILGIVNWSWWLVLLPEIIMFVIYAVVVAAYICFTYKSEKEIAKSLKKWKGDKE